MSNCDATSPFHNYDLAVNMSSGRKHGDDVALRRIRRPTTAVPAFSRDTPAARILGATRFFLLILPRWDC